MSKQVDERVVEMRFDNQNFEKNVATSMSTLDKLKQKLNLKGAGKSLEEINKSAQNVSFQKMADSLSVLEKRFSTTGIVGMSVINNLTNSAMGFVKKLNSFVISGIKTGGINRAMKIENARFQLGVLLKDSEKVEAVMQNVQSAVDGTAYGMDAAATIASQLAASGMQAGEQMQHSLQAVAGVAAMTNSSYEDIGRIFAQILKKNGFEPYAALCKAGAFNKTDIGVRKEYTTQVGNALCNPIMQAKLLEKAGTDFNVVVGLCVGHDSLFYKYTHTLTTTLVTKDRVLAHNPVGALYQTKAYYKKLMADPASGEKGQ